MKKIICGLLVISSLTPCSAALAQALTQQAAMALAEEFVVENGYTDAAPDRIKRQPDLEPIEWTSDRSEMLERRYNTLRPRAIGAKPGRKGGEAGWSVAFDYSRELPGGRDNCRVVTMDSNGANIRIEHERWVLLLGMSYWGYRC